MNNCANCHAPLEAGDSFCSECGRSVPAATATATAAPPRVAHVPAAAVTHTGTNNLSSYKFFSFIDPLLQTIDDGRFFKRPFQWLYLAFGALCLGLPLYLLGKALENHWFSEGGFPAVLLWVLIAFSGWVSFMIFWNRRRAIDNLLVTGDEFAAVPALAHFLQTAGECYGMMVGILSFGINLILLMSDRGQYLLYEAGRIPYLPFGVSGLVTGPLTGFFIVVLFRVVAELLRSVTAIANNTSRNR